MSLDSSQEIQVLHVDDDPAITDLTGTFLERESDSFAVETATSADEGLQRISDRPPDCVVSDYNMPGMDGLEFLQAVQEEFPELPFILFTGKGSEAVASEAISAGATDYLQKQGGTEQYELLANRIRNAVQARHETQRADRQQTLMRLTEFAGDTGGFEVDTETGEVILTDGARRILDLPDDPDLTVENGLEQFHPEDGTEIRQAVDRAIEASEQTHGTWRYTASDGEQRLLDVTFTPATTDGDTTTLRGAIHDVTDRRERQRDLEQTETLFEHAQDSLFLIDVAEEFTIERVNPAWANATGLSAERVRGKTPRDVLGEQPGAAAEAKYRESIQQQEPLQYEETARFDGELTHWETRIAPVVLDGSVEYIVGATRDVTARKERERELTQTHDLMANMEQLADVGAWEYDSDTETYVMTDGTRRIHRLEPGADLTLEETFESFHPADRGLLTDRFTECLETGESYEVDVRLTTAEGTQRWVTARGERVDKPGSDRVVRGYIRDITEEKTRERQLTELNQAAQDLLTAETHQEVANIGVRAAREILDLQANAVHLCEADDTLTPVAQSDELTSLVDEVPALSVADSIAGRVYQHGEPTVVEDVRQDPDVHELETDLRGHVYLPLGDHGILIAGSQEQAAFDQQDQALGELLAGNLVAAFDRIDREQTARQQQKQLSLFFEESPLGAVQWDDEFRFERVNGRAEEILGYSEPELRGESWETIVADDDSGQVADAVESLLAAEGGIHVINSNVRKNDETLTCEWHNRAVTGANGDVQSVFSKFQDVTDRERRKTELQEYETIIEALSDAVYVLDEEGRFTYVNDEFIELVGYDRETILGNTPSLIKDEEAVERAEQELGRLLSSDGPQAVTFEVTVQPRDGDPIVCEDHMGILPYEGDQFNGSVGTLRDITDRREREETLQEIKGQYQTLVEHFPDGAVFLYDRDLRVVRAGGSELSEVGLSREGIEGTTPQDRYPPDIAKELVGNIEDALAGKSRTFEQEYRGEHYRIQTVPVRTDDGEITHAMAASQNITDQVESRQTLERQNDLFAKAQDIADIGAWAHDIENGTLTWTDQVYEIHGVSREFDPSLDNVNQLYHPDDQPKLRKAVDQAVTAGEPYDLEVRMTAKDDGTRWFRTVADPQIENGDVVRVRGTVHDITDRVEREQELRQYEHFFENSPDQIALLDEDFTVQYQSPPSSLHELDAIEVEGDNPLEYVHPEDRETLSNHFEQLVMNPDESFSEAFRAKASSGEWRWVETRAINLLNEEPADGILVMIRDITQQKRQRLTLERQNERLDEFASIVGHDLRSPLSVAAGHLELAQDSCESDHLDRAGDAIERSQALIDDLFTLARDGEKAHETEPVGLAEVATSGWQTVERGQATLNIDASQVIEADHSRLQELFENLYRNAIEHGGDDVTVSVGAMDDGFYVADTGPGIPESDREEIFEAGYSTAEDGIGFGLRIVERIAEAHGWESTVTESEQGGARFEILGVEFTDR